MLILTPAADGNCETISATVPLAETINCGLGVPETSKTSPLERLSASSTAFRQNAFSRGRVGVSARTQAA